MPKSTTETIGKHQWQQVTNADIASGSFQCTEGSVLLMTTVGQNPPVNTEGAWLLKSGEGIKGSLSDLWAGVVGGNRVYALAKTDIAKVVTQHG